MGSAVADADVLLLGEHGEIHAREPGLTVPHPELVNRPFERELLDAAGYAPG